MISPRAGTVAKASSPAPVDGEMARYRAAAAQGDTDTAVIFTGEGADLIDDVPSAGEIVTRLVAEAEHALAAAARRVV